MQRAVLILIGLMAVITSGAQENAVYQRKTFTVDSSVLQYRILYPENYTPLVRYPVVLLLHGAGERGNNNESQLKHGGKLFTDPENRKNFPAIVVVPQCPFTDFWARITLNFKE